MEFGLSKLPWYGQVGAFVLVSLVAVGGFYNFYVSPAQTELATKKTQLESLRSDINKGLATARKLPEFQTQVADLEARLESLKAVLPEQKDVGDLLRRLQTLAVQSNLTIKGFRPQPIATRQMHAEWPIVLQLDGTYHNLGMFFDRISKFSRIINVNNVSIKANEKPDQNATISAECTATTFVLLETPAATPAGAKPAQAAAPAR